MRVVVVKHLDVIDNEVGAILDGYSLNNHTTLLFAPWESRLLIILTALLLAHQEVYMDPSQVVWV